MLHLRQGSGTDLFFVLNMSGVLVLEMLVVLDLMSVIAMLFTVFCG
jgi:hypothetical protein